MGLRLTGIDTILFKLDLSVNSTLFWNVLAVLV